MDPQMQDTYRLLIESRLGGRVRAYYDPSRRHTEFRWRPEGSEYTYVHYLTDDLMNESDNGVDLLGWTISVLEEAVRRNTASTESGFNAVRVLGQNPMTMRGLGVGNRIFDARGNPIGMVQQVEMSMERVEMSMSGDERVSMAPGRTTITLTLEADMSDVLRVAGAPQNRYREPIQTVSIDPRTPLGAQELAEGDVYPTMRIRTINAEVGVEMDEDDPFVIACEPLDISEFFDGTV